MHVRGRRFDAENRPTVRPYCFAQMEPGPGRDTKKHESFLGCHHDGTPPALDQRETGRRTTVRVRKDGQDHIKDQLPNPRYASQRRHVTFLALARELEVVRKHGDRSAFWYAARTLVFGLVSSRSREIRTLRLVRSRGMKTGLAVLCEASIAISGLIHGDSIRKNKACIA